MSISILATADNLLAVHNAIMKLASGQRKVRFEHTNAVGEKNSVEYSNVSLPELRALEQQMQESLNPTPLMQGVDVEIDFG